MSPRRPFPIDPVLTGIAIGYRNQAQTLIADLVLPRQEVAAEEFKWNSFPMNESFTVPDTRVGRTSRVNTVTFSCKEETDSVEDYGLDSPIPNSDIKTAADMRREKRSLYDPEKHAAMSLTDLILLDREVRVAGLVQNKDKYNPSARVTLSPTDQFNDYDNSDPLEIIHEAKRKSLIYRPNTAVMGDSVWAKLKRHPVLVNAVRGNLTNKGIISIQEFADLMEIKNVYIGESQVNTARKGQAANLQYCWGNSLELLYIDPLSRTDDPRPTWGMTAQYGTRISGRIEDPYVGLEGGYAIRVGERVKELVIAPDVGVIITNAVTP